MSKVSIIGIDLAKSVFQLHGNDIQGHTRLVKKLKRKELLTALSNQPKCLVAMEACSGSHYWARKITELGHEVKIIDRKSTRLNSSHVRISYAVFCLKKKIDDIRSLFHLRAGSA